MKNKEKFADKIIDFACSEDSIALNTKGEIVGCSALNSCKDCKFYVEGVDCKTAIKRWAEEECVDPMVLARKGDVRLLMCRL